MKRRSLVAVGSAGILLAACLLLFRAPEVPSAFAFVDKLKPDASFDYERAGMTFRERSYRLTSAQAKAFEELLQKDVSDGRLSDREVVPDAITPSGVQAGRVAYRGGAEEHYVVSRANLGLDVRVTVLHRKPSPLLTRLGNLIRRKPW